MSPRGPRRWSGRLGLLLAVLMGAACRPEQVDRPTVNAWLTCVECSDGELDSLRALAARAPATVDTLRTDLLQGPSAAQRGRLTQQLTTTYQRLAALGAGVPAVVPLPFSQGEFVALYLDKMVAIYRGRAAHALGAIGGVRARAVLDSALQLPTSTFPPDLLARIQFARDSLLGP